MKTEQVGDKTMIVGTFNTIAKADRAVHELRATGFEDSQIGVLCSEKVREQSFPDVQAAKVDAVDNTGGSIAAGGAIGGAIGGLALAATAIVTGGASLLAAGAVLVAGGAIAGSFAGAISSFGFDHNTVRFCEEAVAQGKIVVTVYDYPPENARRLAQAQKILEQAGVSEVVWASERV